MVKKNLFQTESYAFVQVSQDRKHRPLPQKVLTFFIFNNIKGYNLMVKKNNF